VIENADIASSTAQYFSKIDMTHVPESFHTEQPQLSDGVLLSVVMPCLNEERTLGVCIDKAFASIKAMNIPAEVVIADNGSTDHSVEIAKAHGARVVHQNVKGYGAALMAGIAATRGKYVVMGDADDSYDWSAIAPIVDSLRGGAELVMGNRFKGEIKPGAMPFLHRYLGNPVLSFLGRLFFRAPIGDFHCGLRGFEKAAIDRLQLQTTGMEFASEMIVKASLAKLRIAEVPVVLRPDGRDRPPHLRTWRDGWRHLRFLLIYSPRWLFLLPGCLLILLGVFGLGLLGNQTYLFGRVGFDIHSMAYAGAAVIVGFQMVVFSLFTKLVGEAGGWLPPDPRLARLSKIATLEAGILVSVLLFCVGIALTFFAIASWSRIDFGGLDPRVTMRQVIPAVTALTLSGEIFLASFFIEVLRVKNVSTIAGHMSPVSAGVREAKS
jgi:glycosyltransferase involved in cell wall biosynthesis